MMYNMCTFEKKRFLVNFSCPERAHFSFLARQTAKNEKNHIFFIFCFYLCYKASKKMVPSKIWKMTQLPPTPITMQF